MNSAQVVILESKFLVARFLMRVCFRSFSCVPVVCMAIALLSIHGASWGLAQETISFRGQIAPLLRDHCLACHGPKKAEGGYRIDHFDSILASGDSGETPIVPKSSDESSIFQRLIHEDPGLRMPADSEPMDEDSIRLVKQWIDQGAVLDLESPGDRKKSLLDLMPTTTYLLPESRHGPVPITALCFSPDARHLLVGGYHEVDLWNVETWKLEARIGNVMERVMAIQFHPNGKDLLVAGGTPGRLGEVRIFNWETREFVTAIGRTGEIVLDMALSPTGGQIAVAGGDGSLRILDWESKLELKSLASHADAVQAVAYSSDGTKLASASRDKTAKVYDAKSFDLLATYADHGSAVRGIAFAPDGLSVYSAGLDKKIYRWSVDGPKRLAEVAGAGELFRGTSRGNWLLFPTSTAKLHLLDSAAGTQTRILEGASDWVSGCALSLEGKRIAAGSFDGQLYVWGLENGELQKQWKAIEN